MKDYFREWFNKFKESNQVVFGIASEFKECFEAGTDAKVKELLEKNEELVTMLEIARTGILWYIENSVDANECDSETLIEIDKILLKNGVTNE